MQEMTANYPPSDIETLLTKFSPLVKATAARYQGRGAEYDDLVQEGYLALLALIPKCRDERWLAAFLKNRLPGYVRAAAWRMRGRGASPLDEEFESFLPDERSGEERGEVELRELLARTLTAEELDVTQALLEGFTQTELAELMAVSQQAISAKIRKIKDKLRPHVGACH